MRRSVAAAAVIAVPLALLFFLSGEVSALAALAATAAVVFVVLCAGHLLLRAAGANDFGLPAAWVLGLTATAVALLILVLVFQLLAASAFAIWALIVLALGFRYRGEPGPGLMALALCGAATLFWCWDIAQVPTVLARDGVLATWTDQFYHGAAISQFGDPRSDGRGTNLLADAPLPPYHYGSYLLPATLAWPLDLPGLPLATSVWVPLGFFTTCAGAYALGAALGGPFGGMAALAAVTLIPDAASYGLANRAFGYYWHQLEVPGGAYAVGACLVAFALLRRGAAGAVVAAAALPIRLHVFLLAFPAWIASAAFIRGRMRLLAALAAGLAIFVFAYYALVPGATPAVGQFLELARNPYLWLYHTGLPRLGAGTAIAVGTLLLIPAILGVFVLLYPLSVWLLYRARRLERHDIVPAAVLVTYLLLVLAAPVPPHGDPTELPHRPFVLVYAVIAVWTAAGFARWAEGYGGWRNARIRIAVVALAALTALLGVWYTVRDARLHRTYEVAAGLPQAARFLRAHAQPGDVLAVQGLARGPVYTDHAVQLVALTGTPAYLSVPHMRATLGGQAGEVRARYEALAGIAEEKDAQAARARLRELGVRWYVVVDKAGGPSWDRARSQAAFLSRDTAVYASQ